MKRKQITGNTMAYTLNNNHISKKLQTIEEQDYPSSSKVSSDRIN